MSECKVWRMYDTEEYSIEIPITKYFFLDNKTLEDILTEKECEKFYKKFNICFDESNVALFCNVNDAINCCNELNEKYLIALKMCEV